MAASSQGHFEGNFDSLDLAEFAKKHPWWRKLFGQESGPSSEKYSMATQLLIGGVTGWCTGFIFQKAGKLAATAVGGGFFLLQLANHTVYIKVDWQRVEKDMKKAKEQLKIHKSNQIPTEVKSKAEEVVSFVKKNVLVTGGFFGGFLLGMASKGGYLYLLFSSDDLLPLDHWVFNTEAHPLPVLELANTTLSGNPAVR